MNKIKVELDHWELRQLQIAMKARVRSVRKKANGTTSFVGRLNRLTNKMYQSQRRLKQRKETSIAAD